MEENFNKDYFIKTNNLNLIKSNYIDYRTKKFSKLSEDIIEIFELSEIDKKNVNILDFGCATGGLLNELKNKGFTNVKGTDVSNWAIEYGKGVYKLENELEFYNRNLLCEPFNYMIMLDVIEHLPNYELETVLKLANKGLKNKLLIRIPVSLVEGEDFVLEVSKNDRTHIQIHSKKWWVNTLEEYGFIYLTDIYKESIFNSDGVFCGLFKSKSFKSKEFLWMNVEHPQEV